MSANRNSGLLREEEFRTRAPTHFPFRTLGKNTRMLHAHSERVANLVVSWFFIGLKYCKRSRWRRRPHFSLWRRHSAHKSHSHKRRTNERTNARTQKKTASAVAATAATCSNKLLITSLTGLITHLNTWLWKIFSCCRCCCASTTAAKAAQPPCAHRPPSASSPQCQSCTLLHLVILVSVVFGSGAFVRMIESICRLIWSPPRRLT